MFSADFPSQKFGRSNEATPAKWNSEYKDYGPPPGEGSNAQPQPTKVEKDEAAPTAAPNGSSDAMEVDTVEANGEKKKSRKHEGETPEEKAERKRRKKEKKAAKKAGGDKKVASDDDE